ncbi:hypothetical protein [Reinekea marinisedimentorum]|uniref:hypothetical protein n=1 Tax=Reinekea marinisedimentorum TaxID=230495 RepID=UPI001049369D|nr:hypothetical protein [Reinekea marinisedimentorum]
MHANALSLTGTNKAIALLAPSRTGKTTLTVALAGNGFEMMTDDMLALHQSSATGNAQCTVEVYPGWPEVRLWPDSLKASGFNLKNTDKVHEQFSKVKLAVEGRDSAKKRLETIYFLNRVEPGEKKSDSEVIKDSVCEIKPMSKSVALVQLLQNSMLGSAFQKIGLEEERFQALSNVVNSVQMKQVNFRSGFDHLDTVCEMIKQDAKG